MQPLVTADPRPTTEYFQQEEALRISAGWHLASRWTCAPPLGNGDAMSDAIDIAPPLAAPETPKIRTRIVAMLVATVLLATTATFFGAMQYFERSARADADNQLALYLRSLNEALKQHQHLPYILAENEALVRAVEGGNPEALNPMLADFAQAAGLEAIYVMDPGGTVTAASNAGTPQSFLGQNYRFRPYFQEALAGQQSDYFAIGATTGRPGYFVAVPLSNASGARLGAVVIKLDVSELQAAWEERGEPVLAVNAQGITVLSADPDWLYRATTELMPIERELITNERQFGNQPLEPFGWQILGDKTVSVSGERYLLASDTADFQGWTVHYLTPRADIRQQTILTTAFAGAIVTVLIGFATFLRSQRIETALEASQLHRKELIATNAQLLKAQEELARTAKLAALGQLAASVTHELGQPISALKNHLAAAEMGNEITSPTTAANLRQLAERMESISSELRFFARGRTSVAETFDLAEAIKQALELLFHDMRGVSVDLQLPRGPVQITARRIEIEQALVNLIRNGLQAAKETALPAVEISLVTRNGDRIVSVADNGAGLGDAILADLQEPFYSTKPSGVGMGLGLAITTEILRAHGGALNAVSRSDGGAVFEMTVPEHAR